MARTWKEGRFTSMFDFPLAFAIADVFCRGASPAKLGAVLTDDRRYPDPSRLVTLVDNHDLPRLLSLCGGDGEKVRQALSFLFAMRGVPSLTWGTEVGLDGLQEPENRKSMRFVAHPLRAHIAEGMRRRAELPALREGRAVVLEVGPDRLVVGRTGPEPVTVTVERGQVSLARVPQLTVASGTRLVRFEGPGAVVGSGPELGDWQLPRAVPLPVTLELPLHGVFEFKRVRAGAWEPGENRVLFVTPGDGVLLAP